MLAERQCTVAVLAAQRAGRVDPLAEQAGVSHKCLVPIGGKPLILHVLAALSEARRAARVRIVVEPEAVPKIEALGLPEGIPAIDFVPAAANLADSVYAAAEGTEPPLVVTTADNVLLTPEAVEQVAARLFAGDDVAIAFARRGRVLAAHPDGQRNFYRFADAHYSNCNLYGLSFDGLGMAEAFRGGGHFAANPMRIARAFGWLNLVRMRLGLDTLDGAMDRLSRRFGVRFAAVELEDGAHAIDVDNERTFSVARQLLESRAAGA